MSRPVAQRTTRRIAGVVLAAIAIVAMTGCGGSTPAKQPPLGFRSLPTFLPTTSAPVDRVVTASIGHPQLAVQGVAVRVDLPHGEVLATVTGPKVPPFVAPPPPEVTATFTITLAAATGTVPVRLSDFSLTDQLGRTYRPSLLTGEPTPPTGVVPGHTVRFQVNAVMPTGEGRLHWAPTGARLVSWDFVVEND